MQHVMRSGDSKVMCPQPHLLVYNRALQFTETLWQGIKHSLSPLSRRCFQAISYLLCMLIQSRPTATPSKIRGVWCIDLPPSGWWASTGDGVKSVAQFSSLLLENWAFSSGKPALMRGSPCCWVNAQLSFLIPWHEGHFASTEYPSKDWIQLDKSLHQLGCLVPLPWLIHAFCWALISDTKSVTHHAPAHGCFHRLLPQISWSLILQSSSFQALINQIFVVTLGYFSFHARVSAGSVVSHSLQSMDCSPPGSSVHGISQARVLGWVAISYSRGSSQPRDWTRISCVSCIGRRILYHWAIWEALSFYT